MVKEHEKAKITAFESKYEIGKKLGEGCSASVHICRRKDDVSGTLYAVKIFREDDEEKRKILLKEPKVLAKLNHPNIVRFIEHFDNEATKEIHMVMEYVDGKEVFDHLSEQPAGVYNEEMAKDVFKQLLIGLDYLHKNGICHRDIKPQNLFITKKDNKVLILDFNVAAEK